MYENSNRQNDLTAILIKPAGPDCNLACTYCFYREKADLFRETARHRMSDQVLEATMKQMMRLSSRHISLGWQGGEPTLMGLDFFERALAYQIQYGRGKIVGNSLQTNGRLIDAAWARFLKKYNFLVGISIDGPAGIHNIYRTKKNGDGSFDDTLRAVHILKDHGVTINALTVVNDRTARCPEEIYNTLKTLGFSYHQYIPCSEPAPRLSSDRAPFSVSAESYGAFLVTLFDLWFDDFEDGVPTTSIRLFDALLEKHMGAPPSECTLLETCGIYLVVEHNGDVFPCDFFVDEETRLGNLLVTPIEDLFQSQKMKDFGAEKRRLGAPCLACEWRTLCRGGCPKERPLSEGDASVNYYCSVYKMLFAHAESRLKQTAETLERRAVEARRTEVAAALKSGVLSVGRNEACPCGSGRKFKRCCGR